MDPRHEVEAIVATGGEQRLVGFAHYRPFARPLGASVGCFLDDLFVSPQARGSGAADALLGHLQSLAHEGNWSVIRWITADDNYRVRATYDRHATRTMWITYDMSPLPPKT
jgi:GNAT superfamily N-acetyltransferase